MSFNRIQFSSLLNFFRLISFCFPPLYLSCRLHSCPVFLHQLFTQSPFPTCLTSHATIRPPSPLSTFLFSQVSSSHFTPSYLLPPPPQPVSSTNHLSVCLCPEPSFSPQEITFNCRSSRLFVVMCFVSLLNWLLFCVFVLVQVMFHCKLDSIFCLIKTNYYTNFLSCLSPCSIFHKHSATSLCLTYHLLSSLSPFTF